MIDSRLTLMGIWQCDFNRSCYRQFGVSLTIKLGDYAKKQQPTADTSRLQRGL